MNVLVLNTTTKSIEIKLAGAITTNQLDVTAHYADATTSGFTEASNDTATNDTTAVTVVAAPSASTQRIIREITVHNKDTASATVTIQLNNNSTIRIIKTVTLAAGEEWVLSDGASSGSASISDGDKGDITVSGSGAAWTIDNNAVTFAKMQAITDGVLLGASGGTAVEEITVGSGLSLSANTLTATGGSGGIAYNYLINGGFDFAQRQAPATLTARADDTYCADRWYVLTNGGSTDIQFARTAGDTTSALSSKYAGQIKQVNAAAKYMGVAQIIESFETQTMRGKTVTFQFRAKSSTTTAIKCAIVEWTGTADSVTSDIVNTWTSTTYTTGNFFVSTTTTIAGVMAGANATTSYGAFSLSAAISTSATNVIVFVWTEGTAAQNVTLDITQADLHVGSSSQVWTPRLYENEFALCRRYYEKSLSVDSDPLSGTIYANYVAAASVAASTYFYNNIFTIQKRISPSITIRPFTTRTNTSRVSNNVGTDLAANSGTAASVSEVGFSLSNNSGGTITLTGNIFHYLFEADAEL